jgi:NADH:ubiquinone oxidoreductase subunit
MKRNGGQFKTGTMVGIDEYGNKYYEDNVNENVNDIAGIVASFLALRN